MNRVENLLSILGLVPYEGNSAGITYTDATLRESTYYKRLKALLKEDLFGKEDGEESHD